MGLGWIKGRRYPLYPPSWLIMNSPLTVDHWSGLHHVGDFLFISTPPACIAHRHMPPPSLSKRGTVPLGSSGSATGARANSECSLQSRQLKNNQQWKRNTKPARVWVRQMEQNSSFSPGQKGFDSIGAPLATAEQWGANRASLQPRSGEQ